MTCQFIITDFKYLVFQKKITFILAPFGVLLMVPLVILPRLPLVKPMVPLDYQWYHWYHWESQQNGITTGTICRTLNDIGIPLVPLVEP